MAIPSSWDMPGVSAFSAVFAARFKRACQAALDGYRLLQGLFLRKETGRLELHSVWWRSKHPLLESFPVLSARQ
ncbi:hypothetical protein CEXT_253151 [Caerostris extrusa]|uniref:Uncharacterized protein n=1 Tax=Caerostris extrusa TaxID=172846 RepID=A0AAV4WXS9_CAEEX|nr:hypothetical protein CEXT_253151 [Caerostris extrusa]